MTDNTGIYQGASGNDVMSMCMATTSFMFSSISFSRASCSPDSLAVATKQWSGFKPWSWQEYFHLEKIWFCSLATPDCSMARYEWKCADVINLFQFQILISPTRFHLDHPLHRADNDSYGESPTFSSGSCSFFGCVGSFQTASSSLKPPPT